MGKVALEFRHPIRLTGPSQFILVNSRFATFPHKDIPPFVCRAFLTRWGLRLQYLNCYLHFNEQTEETGRKTSPPALKGSFKGKSVLATVHKIHQALDGSGLDTGQRLKLGSFEPPPPPHASTAAKLWACSGNTVGTSFEQRVFYCVPC